MISYSLVLICRQTLSKAGLGCEKVLPIVEIRLDLLSGSTLLE